MIANLAQDAHRIAVSKGFWRRETSASVVATKVALIHTEIEEVRDADRLDIDIGDELADIAIRTLDLAVSLDTPLVDYDIMSTPVAVETEIEDLHTAAALITQSDRRDDPATRRAALIHLIRSLLYIASERDLDLWSLVQIKQEYNRNRPELHDRRY